MRMIWLVIKHDAAATLRLVSFWILTLALPVLFLVSQRLPGDPAEPARGHGSGRDGGRRRDPRRPAARSAWSMKPL